MRSVTETLAAADVQAAFDRQRAKRLALRKPRKADNYTLYECCLLFAITHKKLRRAVDGGLVETSRFDPSRITHAELYHFACWRGIPERIWS